LLVDIHLPETSGTTIARVVRKEPIPEDHRGRVAVGLQMEDISPTFQDEIIGYLFQQQRERRSKGIL
jgi:c-di-GMP-binding flagellar brake protein YcgR